MALILSIAHIIIAIRESRLSETRTEIERQRVSPQFVVSIKRQRDINFNATAEEVMITNQGGLVWSFRCSTLIVLTVQYWTEKESGGTGTVTEITVADYYKSLHYSNQTSGELVRISAGNSPMHLNQLSRDFESSAVAIRRRTIISMRRYIEIEYEDLLGDKQIKYYEIGDLGDEVYKLDSSEGELIFRRALAIAPTNAVLMRFLTVQKLWECFEKNCSEHGFDFGPTERSPQLSPTVP